MKKLSLQCDYNNGAHPEILQKLIETNSHLQVGYGDDEFSISAKEKIKKVCNSDEINVYLLAGGTQTNMIVISSLLKSYEGVITADTGHVSIHEAGAIEYHGHKVLTLNHHNGKIDADLLKEYIDNFNNDENREHMVFPGMVYISYPTENGTLYSKNELEKIYKICKENNLYLYIDGARLGYGLMSNNCDLTIEDLPSLCDVFYIGGTKVGALCGEALIFKKDVTPKHFNTIIKQHGALMSKGRLLGIQFDALFTDNLYFDISKNAIDKANKLRSLLRKKEFRFAWESPTNQQFVILENSYMTKLSEKVDFSFWERYNANHTVVRFATSWSTTDDDINKLKQIFDTL